MNAAPFEGLASRALARHSPHRHTITTSKNSCRRARGRLHAWVTPVIYTEHTRLKFVGMVRPHSWFMGLWVDGHLRAGVLVFFSCLPQRTITYGSLLPVRTPSRRQRSLAPTTETVTRFRTSACPEAVGTPSSADGSAAGSGSGDDMVMTLLPWRQNEQKGGGVRRCGGGGCSGVGVRLRLLYINILYSRSCVALFS